MKDMFKITDIQLTDTDLLIKEGTVEIDISCCGAALRKIFAAFVLLYTLAMTPEKKRIYLFEEPESLIYPGLLQHFLYLFIQDARKAHLQMLIVSNSDEVRHLLGREVSYFWKVLIIRRAHLLCTALLEIQKAAI